MIDNSDNVPKFTSEYETAFYIGVLVVVIVLVVVLIIVLINV